MKVRIRHQWRRRQRRIRQRLDKADRRNCHRPIRTAADRHYEIAEPARGIARGGLGAMHALARQVGLIDAIDRRLHLLQFHFP